MTGSMRELIYISLLAGFASGLAAALELLPPTPPLGANLERTIQR